MSLSKADYLLWAARRWLGADVSCPSCSSADVGLVKRKYLVTGLYRCGRCRLMYRVPKNTAEEAHDFYQEKYEQGFTTDCPDGPSLERLLGRSFRGSEKDYTKYINVLEAAGVLPGQTILDFGCSWGYGSWQFARAGYDVYSYEISKPRAQYAAEKLGCRVLPHPEAVPREVDCFFSAHVIEHLMNPRILWEHAARVLKRGGVLVLFMPNGEPGREQICAGYHYMWGQVHPLLLCADSLKIMADRYGFKSWAYSSPYDPERISRRDPGDLSGEELLFVAER